MAIFERVETAPGQRRKLRLKSPVTYEVLGEIECASKEDIDAAVAAAHAAQKEWAKKTPAQRAKVILKARDIVLKRQDEIMEVVIRETGKPPADALSMEIFASCDMMSYYAKNAEKFLATEKRKLHGVMSMIKTLRVAYKPLGVVGVITPWNGPFILSMNPTQQALLAGNGVILKGSEVTPESAQLVARVFKEAGLPEGLLHVVYGDGQTGADLLDADIQKVSFTGSVPTGRKVGEACGRNLIPCSLELGGTDAMIICADANFELATDAALYGSCINTGHYCCGTQRIYVVESLYDKFVARVTEKAKALRQGQKYGQDEDIGAVFWDKQVTIIEEHVKDAIDKGARLLHGGGRNPDLEGLYFMPTVLADCDHSMLAMREENFGPLVCLQKVRDEAEAIRLTNDSPYGLNGTVFSKDREKAFQIALQMDTGSVCVNDIAVTYGVPEAPFGGRKASGVGQVNGVDGLRKYSHAFPVILNRFNMPKLPASYPYSAKAIGDTKKLMKFIWKPGK
ncbi:Aldehyde dehydrogenase (NAD) family protein [Sterolibacterium denitrificans]|uniref:Aldehyde dehydrogenase (NAD) family protein n=1 Tax=Sterolibacterium denitrificans TaxID=157592 RepID=A0A7Z7HPD8_9PROT|nr:aldehyde dehydrogenase family protein [Sterolibacterium denitrificans]SMB22572.1 Aldehyde dehydrogenase (NAD) family protein [Sterolibacterium denitrificans]